MLGGSGVASMLIPINTLCTTYYSNPYVLWMSWLIPWFLVDGAYWHFIPHLGRLRDWTTFTGIFPASCSGSYLGIFCKFSKSGLRFPNGALKSLKVLILTMVGNFDHLLSTLRLICGVLGRKSVAYLGYLCCRAKEWFIRGMYSIKFWSYGR